MMAFRGLLATLLAAGGFAAGTVGLLNAAEPRSALAVTSDFPGGSGVVDRLDAEMRRIVITPTPHPERGWDCWWYVKVSGLVPGEMLTLDIGPAPWATPDRAAVSLDRRDWKQTAPGRRDGKRIVYSHRAEAETLWFAWGPPFLPDDAQALVDEAAKAYEQATAFELCKSRGGRPVPALQIVPPEAKPGKPFGVVICARQHAWESGSSWVCRGLVEWLVSDDPRARSLRERVRFDIVPIMDVDNVAIGAGGKSEQPRDHNRDWSDQPHWHAVAALQKRIKERAAAESFDLFVDLHNPDAGAKAPYFYIPPRGQLPERGLRNLDRFLGAAGLEMTGPLAYRGEARESGPSYDPNWRLISKNWVAFHTAPHVVAVTLETAWNTPESTTAGYLAVGRQLGLAIDRYLRASPRE